MTAPVPENNAIALEPIAYRGRIARFREAVRRRARDEHGHGAQSRVDGFILTDAVSVRWLTGFTGSAATVAVLPDSVVLITDGRYAERAVAELASADVDAHVVVGATQLDQQRVVAERLHGVAAIGVDPASVSHSRWQALAAELPIVPMSNVITDLRRVKDGGELARIARACAITDRALAAVAPRLGDGVTEADVRNELDHLIRLYGASGPSYDTIVASGPSHAARPHHEVSNRTLLQGDTVVIDVGALVDGYHSDMTRSFVIGEPDATQREWYEILHAAQLAGLGAVREGALAADVDAAARRVLTDAGLGEWYVHGTGHGVGLEIHESPMLSANAKVTLCAGEVVTVEPGLYRVGFGGYRIEDLVEVTESGCRVLTTSPKDSPCLPSQPTT